MNTEYVHISVRASLLFFVVALSYRGVLFYLSGAVYIPLAEYPCHSATIPWNIRYYSFWCPVGKIFVIVPRLVYCPMIARWRVVLTQYHKVPVQLYCTFFSILRTPPTQYTNELTIPWLHSLFRVVVRNKNNLRTVLPNYYQHIDCLKRRAAFLTPHSKKQVLQALALSYLDYCPVLWLSAARKDLVKLQLAQNRPAHLALHCNQRADINIMHASLSWQIFVFIYFNFISTGRLVENTFSFTTATWPR
jgi:hypothetical protein